jgi:hypothetical protein
MTQGIYSNFQTSEQTIKLWHRLIGHLEFRIAAQAFKAHMQSSTFAPTPADILRLASEITKPLAEQKTAGEMWQLVRRIARTGRVEYEQKLKEIHPRAYAAAMQVGGFDRIGMCHIEKEMPFVRRDFVRFYDDMSERDAQRLAAGMRTLTGAESTIIDRLKLRGGNDDESGV